MKSYQPNSSLNFNFNSLWMLICTGRGKPAFIRKTSMIGKLLNWMGSVLSDKYWAVFTQTRRTPRESEPHRQERPWTYGCIYVILPQLCCFSAWKFCCKVVFVCRSPLAFELILMFLSVLQLWIFQFAFILISLLLFRISFYFPPFFKTLLCVFSH